jgi:hypothetical protein
MDTNVFGQPDIQTEPVEKEGNNPTLIAILLILILGGGGVLAFLLYRQNQEPEPVLDEVVETIDLQSETTTPEITNELPSVEEDILDSESLNNETILPAPVE